MIDNILCDNGAILLIFLGVSHFPEYFISLQIPDEPKHFNKK